jgi:phosphatidylethanolamine-binding protein (PEBP) family uncharacterized protein
MIIAPISDMFWSTEINLDAGITKAQLLKAMEGHILAQGQSMGRYKR